MPTFTVTPDRLPSLFRERHAERYARVVRAVQDTVMVNGPGLAVRQTQAGSARLRPPINLANYLRGWQAAKLSNGAVLYNDTVYAGIIERGRRPGKMPPKEAIRQWLEQKLRGRMRNRGRRQAEAARLAFVVARAIGRRGLPAHRILAKTKLKLTPQVQRAVREAMEF